MIDWAIDKETAAVIDINLYSCMWKDLEVRKAHVFTTYIGALRGLRHALIAKCMSNYRDTK